MRLCIISLKKFYRHQGKYWTYGGFGSYVRSLIPFFDEVRLCVPVEQSQPPGLYPLEERGLSIVELPFYRNELQLLLKWPAIFWRMRQAIRDSDIANPRIPDMTGVAGWLWSIWYRKPHFVSIQSDMQAFLDAPNNTRTKGLVRQGLYAWIRAYLCFERIIARKSLCFPQGQRLASRYRGFPHAYEWLSSSIHDADICGPLHRDYRGPEIALLHVGRVTTAKGHIFLIRALRKLKESAPQYRFVLRCVGKAEGKLITDLRKEAETLGVADQIVWVGNVEHGLTLWPYFDASHVFVLPSIWEGTPKAILEAMARRLPIVASDVGGVRSSIVNESTGLLVAPQDPIAIASAILRMIHDPQLRDRCVASGITFARAHTVEMQTRVMLEKLKQRHPRFRGLESISGECSNEPRGI